MKKELRKQKDEPIYKWVERVAEALRMTPEQTEAMKEISKESFIQGSVMAEEIFGTIHY